ncbi:STAS domain-containing protein [Streptomyces tauricus]|uniref:STAS domain-containing protein n=1 Tax=Streptomyces tauricus TaxID=68274 RepID=UPI001FE692D7|nr:STAS domain-containing protein [Streptomyces tauricus]MCW8097956.1 STAS domain-containing protein [Streptomyces tauricus]
MYDLKPVVTASWPPPAEHCGLYDGNGLVVVELHGDIDLACAARLRTWLDSVVALRASAYVIDLRAVSFVDSTGLNMFVRFCRRALTHEAAVGVLCRPDTLRLVRAHGTHDVLRPVTTFDEAVARATGTEGAHGTTHAAADRPVRAFGERS